MKCWAIVLLVYLLLLLLSPVATYEVVEKQHGTAAFACEGGISPIIHQVRCNDLGVTQFGVSCCEWLLPDQKKYPYLHKDHFTIKDGGGQCKARMDAVHD